MNRDKSVSSMNSQEGGGTTMAPGFSSLGNKVNPLPPNLNTNNNNASALAMSSQRSTSRLQSERTGLIRPMSAQSPTDSMKFKKNNLVGRGGGDYQENNNTDGGGELTLMDTHKPLIMSQYSGGMDDNLSLRKPKSNDFSDLPQAQSTAPTNGKKSQLTNNLLTPLPAQSGSPTKVPPQNDTSGLNLITSMTQQGLDISGNSGGFNSYGANLIGMTSQHNVQMEVIDTDKELRDEVLLKGRIMQAKGVTISRIRQIGETMMRNLCNCLDLTEVLHLRFEESKIHAKALILLQDYLIKKAKIHSFALVNMKNLESRDLKVLFEGIVKSFSLRQVIFNSITFYDYQIFEAFKKLINDNKQIQELDLSQCTFKSNKLYTELIPAIGNSKLVRFVMRETQISKLESAVMKILFNNCQTIRFIDLSRSIGSANNFDFLAKLGINSSLQNIVIDEIEADISQHMPEIGLAFGRSYRLTNLSMRKNNRIAADSGGGKPGQSWQDAQIQFWKEIMPNKSIRVMNLEDNKITHATCEQIGLYLEQYGVVLTDLNLQKNRIGKKGIKFLSQALKINTSLKVLRLTQNQIGGEDGILEFSEALSENDTLQELYLDQNNLENLGAGVLANFLITNQTLQVLDLSKNNICSQGLEQFSEKLAQNMGLLSLNLAKNKDLIEDVDDGIRAFGNCLGVNKCLRSVDFEGIRINKTQQSRFLSDNLKTNIFLQEFIMKSPLNSEIQENLQDNIDIENKILKAFSLRQDGSTLILDLQYASTLLIRPAIKLVKNLHITQVDFSSMSLSDLQIELIADYLELNLSLKKLIISLNPYITDYGMVRLTQALSKNDRLEKLSFGECSKLTVTSLEQMNNLVKDLNITLWDISCDKTEGGNYSDKAIKLVSEAKLNQNILHILKPNPKNTSTNIPIREVKFDPGARVSKCFDSAIKCWRIMKPLAIDVCDQDLEDDHIIQLSKLLKKDVPMFEQLTLRRNLIKDKGALALAEYIETNPSCFHYLEISRNSISDEGAQAFLKALKKNTRLTTLLFEYGNLITDTKLLREIEQEVFANNLIGKQAKNSLYPEHSNFGTLRINDKGPTYLRGAIKAVEIFDIIELNLSDNLLQFEQAKQIAAMIKMNRYLKVLNLSKNRFKQDSAKLFAEAIIMNENLHHIDLSNNQVKDEGISTLVLPIAQQALRKSMFEQVLAMNISKKPKRWLNENEKEMNIKILNLVDNEHDEESLKHILALLYANKNIIVDIDIPKSMLALLNKDQASANASLGTQNNVLSIQDEVIKTIEVEARPVVVGGEIKKNWRDLIGRFGPVIDYIKPYVSPRKQFHQVKVGPTPEEQLALIKAEEETIKAKEEAKAKESKKKGKKMGVAQRNRQKKNKNKDGSASPDKNYKDDLEAGSGVDQIDNESKKKLVAEQQAALLEQEKKNSCLYKCRQSCLRSDEDKKKPFFITVIRDKYREEQKYARLFKCNEKILTEVENVSQKYITLCIYLSTIFFYLTALLIPMTENDSCTSGHSMNVFVYYAIYAIVSGLMELGLSFYLQRVVNDPELFKINKFHIFKLVSGHLARVDFFSDVLFLMQMYWCSNYGILAAGIIVLIISSTWQFSMLFKLLKTEEKNLLKYIDRNCKLAYITEHVSLAIILDSFSLSNFQSFGGRSIAIPKIISMIKCYSEDLPQFVIQVIYILFYSDKKNDSTGVVVSILLGLLSFAMSIQTAIFAKSSDVDLKLVMSMKEQRMKERESMNQIERQLYLQEGKQKLTTFYNEQQEKKKEYINGGNEVKHQEAFRQILQNLEMSKSKTNKDGTIPMKDRYQNNQMKRSQVSSPNKKANAGDDMDPTGGDQQQKQQLNNSPDTSATNLLQKPSTNVSQVQKKKQPEMAATSTSDTEKGNKKDLITKDNKQLNIKDNLLPTNTGNSPTSKRSSSAKK